MGLGKYGIPTQRGEPRGQEEVEVKVREEAKAVGWKK